MDQATKENLIMDWQSELQDSDKTHETRIQEIANWLVLVERTTNKEVYKEFPGPLYKKAWENLKQRGRRNTMIFFEDGEWIYFP
jgi:hypothetical protein